MYYKGEKLSGPAATDTDFHGLGPAIRRELAKRVPSRRNLRVLDVGTGRGASVEFLLRRLSRDSEIWTIDPSEEVLADVRAELTDGQASRVRFVQANADGLDFEDGFFDIVVSVMVMHHIEDVQASMTEMARVLKRGGRLVIVDYKPEASHRLEFKSRHEEADFFEPKFIGAAAERAGLKARIGDFGLWYLVEASR